MASNSSATSSDATAGDVPEPSRSSSVVKAMSGYHVLKMEGYAAGKKGLGVGKFVMSGDFDVGGQCWCIKYYPNRSSDDADWISIYLNLCSTTVDDVNASYTFSLLDHDDEQPVPEHSRSSSSVREFSRKSWGFRQFMERKALEESPYLRDDCFMLRCDVTVFKETIIEPAPRPLVTVPPPDMHQHLGSLLSAGHGADVTLQVGDEAFPAHRCVLAARSPVFMAELFGPMSQNNKETIHVHDIEPRVFDAMLHFIYNDSLPKVDDDEVVAMAQHLLVAADRYGLERLKLISEDTLCSHVDASTAVTALTLAEQHHCEGLKEACFKFMADSGNLKVVMESDGYLHLTRSCSNVLNKLGSVFKKLAV
uniref:BTB domain-containing protein n=1 Tax=Oryza punctata TaxID=4537 RepID=A0A0E0MHC1_ORYPU